MNDTKFTWQDVENRLRKVIQIFQENIYRLGTSDEVVKFGQDLFMATSQAFNCYATSIVMNENPEPPALIVNMILGAEKKLDELILNCLLEPNVLSRDNALDNTSAYSHTQITVQLAEEVVKKANQYFKDIEKTMAEFNRRRGA